MSKLNLTPEEAQAVRLFSMMPLGIGRRIHSCIAEVIPAIGLVTYGLWASRPVFVITGFGALLFFNGLRMFRQFKYATILRSICSKIEAFQKSDDHTA
jgi:hypothetical protein